MYTVNLKKSVEKELDNLPLKIHDRIISCLILLKENPRPHRVKKLSGREGYRIRIGDYRILYIIDDKDEIVEIISIGHRKDIYG